MSLVDTNIISELARREPDPGVVRWASTLKPPIRVSVVTLEEICFGFGWRPNPRVEGWFERFFERECEVLTISESIARQAGELRGRFRSLGETRTQADMLIAATAQAHQLSIVTRNVRDFAGCGVAILNPFANSQEE